MDYAMCFHCSPLSFVEWSWLGLDRLFRNEVSGMSTHYLHSLFIFKGLDFLFRQTKLKGDLHGL